MGLMDAYVAGNEGSIPNEPVNINEKDAVAMLTEQMKALGQKLGTVPVSNNKVLPKLTVEVALGLIVWWLNQAESQNGFQTYDVWSASENFRNDVTRVLTNLNAIKNGLKGAPPKHELSATQIEQGYGEIKKLAILMNTNGIQTSPFVMAWDSVKEATKEALDKGKGLLFWGAVIGGGLLVGYLVLTREKTVIVSE